MGVVLFDSGGRIMKNYLHKTNKIEHHKGLIRLKVLGLMALIIALAIGSLIAVLAFKSNNRANTNSPVYQSAVLPQASVEALPGDRRAGW